MHATHLIALMSCWLKGILHSTAAAAKRACTHILPQVRTLICRPRASSPFIISSRCEPGSTQP